MLTAVAVGEEVGTSWAISPLQAHHLSPITLPDQAPCHPLQHRHTERGREGEREREREKGRRMDERNRENHCHKRGEN